MLTKLVPVIVPVKMYGVEAKDLKFKAEFVDNPDDDEEKWTVDFDKLVTKKIKDPYIRYVYTETNGENHDYIGIPSGYPWTKEPEIDTEFGAASYIAFMLGPYCKSTRNEIIKACRYIEDVREA